MRLKRHTLHLTNFSVLVFLQLPLLTSAHFSDNLNFADWWGLKSGYTRWSGIPSELQRRRRYFDDVALYLIYISSSCLNSVWTKVDVNGSYYTDYSRLYQNYMSTSTLNITALLLFVLIFLSILLPLFANDCNGRLPEDLIWCPSQPDCRIIYSFVFRVFSGMFGSHRLFGQITMDQHRLLRSDRRLYLTAMTDRVVSAAWAVRYSINANRSNQYDFDLLQWTDRVRSCSPADVPFNF